MTWVSVYSIKQTRKLTFSVPFFYHSLCIYIYI
ncbi:hypothetical protein SEUBUCD646_0D01180 [Saccharomyces eubayanus]|uniref:Uncharacterized protein n=1 Tax=Saccharomyces eubayanus TaxID=1080349 RepID=A0ABN8VLY5_SACEU|nr:hypothetical protein SEUBUCD650_0D01170 [Saccharomyces eubayanus]CAI1928857.1 hypothetical protein SEUBUCD646_0D01180 [Saccharomyces eubayanus]